MKKYVSIKGRNMWSSGKGIKLLVTHPYVKISRVTPGCLSFNCYSLVFYWLVFIYLLLRLPELKFRLSFLRSVANCSQVVKMHAWHYDATFILRHAVCFHGAHWNHGFVFILNTEKSLSRTWNETKKQGLILKWF